MGRGVIGAGVGVAVSAVAGDGVADATSDGRGGVEPQAAANSTATRATGASLQPAVDPL